MPRLVEPKALQLHRNLGRGVLELLSSATTVRKELVMISGVQLNVIIDVGHKRFGVAREECLESIRTVVVRSGVVAVISSPKIPEPVGASRPYGLRAHLG